MDIGYFGPKDDKVGYLENAHNVDRYSHPEIDESSPGASEELSKSLYML